MFLANQANFELHLAQDVQKFVRFLKVWETKTLGPGLPGPEEQKRPNLAISSFYFPQGLKRPKNGKKANSFYF
jgi:hypothetical protein